MINTRALIARREEAEDWDVGPDPNFTCGLSVCVNKYHHLIGADCKLS